MARGGLRPGAGRPKSKASPTFAKAPADIKRAARQSGMNPLDYMLTVMNDADAEDARRDRMAIAAAPFVHAKPGERPVGKKEEAAEAALTAGEGSDWGSDLREPSLN